MSALQFGGLSDTALRLAVFVILLAVLLGLQSRWPRRTPPSAPWRRWRAHAALLLLGSLGVRLLAWLSGPLVAVGAAHWAAAQGWGLLNQFAAAVWLEGLFAVLVLDCAIWAQHRAMHDVPLLWRLHRIHHADAHMDVTTALRFHPIEIMGSMLFKSAVVVALGATPVAVIAFEILLNGAAMFNHANLRLPERLDRLLRPILVTPDMHRIHHSVHRDEQNSNFGFSLSVWDRWFGCYRAAPVGGQLAMRIGVAETPENRVNALGWLLAWPLRSGREPGMPVGH